jgi:hypothetical protein
VSVQNHIFLPSLFYDPTPYNATAMSHTQPQARRVIPAQLGFLAIYNPSLGNTDDTLDQQIVYYSSTEARQEVDKLRRQLDSEAFQDAAREQNNEQLRQIGFAQGMVEFGRSFSEGRAVDTIETAKSRIILHELEAGWWILAGSVHPPTQPSFTLT